MSRRIGLIGGAVGHSVSPAMHRAALGEMALNWTYEARAVAPGELAAFADELRDGDWVGVNVTLPHKHGMMDYLDELDPEAERIGAVNTVVARDGRLRGYNTDAAGLRRDMRQQGMTLTGRQVVLLGAGGAARAVAWGLADGHERLSVIARTPARAREWTPALADRAGVEIEVWPWTEEAFPAVDPTALIVQATPVGMWPNVMECPWPHDVPLPENGAVYDLVYRPKATQLVQRARRAGLPAWSGLGMLVEQGALALELWTGRPAPRTVMRTAAERALEVDLDRIPDGR